MKVLAMVMAGGQGTRLHPLTAERSKPSVPFGSRYRITDFVLSSTSDAVFQNINLIERHAPDMVAVFGADHVYRMDVRQMIDFHHQNSAHVSVAAIPIPLAEASAFGIIDADGAGRIKGFLEKPKTPPPMVSDPSRIMFMPTISAITVYPASPTMKSKLTGVTSAPSTHTMMRTAMPWASSPASSYLIRSG